MDRTAQSYGLVMLCSIIFGSILLTSFFAQAGITSLLLRYLIIYGLLYLLPGFIYFRNSHEPIQWTLKIFPVRFRILLYSILLAFCLQPLLMSISSLTSLFFSNYVDGALDSYVQQPLWSTLIAAALLPAVCEELCCRGIFLTHCSKASIWASALFSGIFFGILHMNLQQGLYAVLFGFCCALLTLWTGSTVPSMVTHLIINASQLLLSYAAAALPADPASYTSLQSVLSYILDGSHLGVSFLIAIPFTLVALFCFYRIYKISIHS